MRKTACFFPKLFLKVDAIVRKSKRTFSIDNPMLFQVSLILYFKANYQLL